MLLTPGRWLAAMVAVAVLCCLFLFIGIAIGRATASNETEQRPQGSATTAVGPTSPTAHQTAPAATPEKRDLPPLGQGQGHLLVKTSQPDAHVYVAGRPTGLPNQVLVVPCGLRNVRIGTVPLTRWLSPSKTFDLVCGSKTTLWLETNRAVHVKSP